MLCKLYLIINPVRERWTTPCGWVWLPPDCDHSLLLPLPLLAVCQEIFFLGYHVCMQTPLRGRGWGGGGLDVLTPARARSCHAASQRSSFKSQHVSRTSPHTAPSGCCFIHHCSKVGGPEDPTPAERCTWRIGGEGGLCLCVYVFVWDCLPYTPHNPQSLLCSLTHVGGWVFHVCCSAV